MSNSSHLAPPRLSDALLRLVLSQRDRDSVSGDLLEEFRDLASRHGAPLAARWYRRQAVWYLMRSAAAWGGLVAVALLARYAVDVMWPVADYMTRSRIMSWSIIGLFMAGSGYAVVRTGRALSGIVVVLAMSLIGALGSSLGTALSLVIWHDPVTAAAWRASGDIAEALLLVPLLLFPIGLIAGIQGTLAGWIVTLGIRSYSARWRETSGQSRQRP